MALITYLDDTTKEVKNLGWMLSNTDIIDFIEINEGPLRRYGAHLRVWIRRDQTKYAKAPLRYDTLFSSRELLHRFLDRPSLRDLEVVWFGDHYTIGSPEYRALDANPIY